MAAELGETTNPKDLIPGEPEAISADLRKLVGNVERLGAVKDGLHGVEPGQWTGQASEAFRSAFSAVPTEWEAAIETIGGKAAALANYGDALTWGQCEAQRAIEQYTQAQAASRAAAAQYNAQAQQAQTADQPMAPFQDPGQAGAQQAQKILDDARKKLEEVGDLVAGELGVEKKNGKFSKSLSEYGKEFGTEHRKKGWKWNKEKEEYEEDDNPDGWQRNKGGGNYRKSVGNDQSSGLFTDNVSKLLDGLGIDVPGVTESASASAALAEGELGGRFDSGALSGSGKLSGGVVGAGAEAHAGANALGVNAGASAEAYLAKGHAEGELRAGPAAVKGSADGLVGAEAKADGKLSWTGAQGSAEAFAGARVKGDASASVAGVGAGVQGEAWAGVGAEASGQVGMGEDGKFHLGASAGIGFGVGAKVGFDIAIDPAEVTESVQNVAGSVGDVASEVGNGMADAADSVGNALGF